jgi:mono/diheme cytochrome c family protein
MINNLLHITGQTNGAVNPGFKVNSRFNITVPGNFRVYLLGLILLGSLAAISCTSGTYPVDIFYEMHYQQSYKSHEPPRLSAPASAVAFFPGPKSTAFNTGEHLFAVNCAMCHGDGAKGDGEVVKRLETYGYTPLINPPDLTDNTPGSIVGLLMATDRPFGPDSVMPPFGKLLSAEEREAISNYVGTLPK